MSLVTSSYMSNHLMCHIWVEAMHWGGVRAAPVSSWHLSQALAASYFANPAARPPLPCLLACICSLGAARQCPPLPQQRSPCTSCCEGPDACARAVTGFTLRGSTSPDKEQKATSSCLAFAASACWWAGSAMWPWCPACPCCICEGTRAASRSTSQSHVSGARSTTLQDCPGATESTSPPRLLTACAAAGRQQAAKSGTGTRACAEHLAPVMLSCLAEVAMVVQCPRAPPSLPTPSAAALHTARLRAPPGPRAHTCACTMLVRALFECWKSQPSTAAMRDRQAAPLPPSSPLRAAPDAAAWRPRDTACWKKPCRYRSSRSLPVTGRRPMGGKRCGDSECGR